MIKDLSNVICDNVGTLTNQKLALNTSRIDVVKKLSYQSNEKDVCMITVGSELYFVNANYDAIISFLNT
jgi:hypothetical protein